MKTALEPIFIVGIPRSGTTWLLSLLEQHPQCWAITPEAIGIIPQQTTKETGIFLRGLPSRVIVDRFSRLPTDRVPVEKTPGHLLQAGRIKRVFPQARIVLIRRDPQDVIWSMIQENSFWKESPKNIGQAVSLYNQFSNAQEIYTGYDAVIDYELLWENPVEELVKLLSTLGLDPTPASKMVGSTRKGKSLPSELRGVFRNGAPGEGRVHFSDDDHVYMQSHLYTPKRNPRQLSLLLATNHLLGWTGSETLLLTLIESLHEHGCKLTVYTRHWNQDWLDKYFDNRIRLTNDLETVKRQRFDLAHVQHSSCLVDVRAAFPNVPVVLSSLGVLPFLEQPPPFEMGVSHYVAISEEVANNLVASGVSREQISIIRNMVRSDWFYPTSTIKQHLGRILVLSYKMGEERKSLLRDVAKQIRASIRFIGGKDGAVAHDRLCEAINNVDVVVTLGRGVIETMLCGRIPLVFDVHGGDGLVTPETLSDLWTCNFSGRRYGREYTANELVAELSKYQGEMGEQLRDLALSHFCAKQNILLLISLYRRIVLESTPSNLSDDMPVMLKFFSALTREDLQQSNQHLEHELSEISRIKGTISWRITAPLRVINNFGRKFFKGLRRILLGGGETS